MKELVQNSLVDGKAEDIVILDLHGKTDIADYMVVASGTSSRHTVSLAEKLIERVKKTPDFAVISVEGMREGEWAS